MKLFYAPGACSLSPHIVAREAGIGLVLERVDLTTKRTASSTDYTRISAKGPLLNPATSDLVREEKLANLNKRRALIEGHLARHPHLVGESFSVADAYLFSGKDLGGVRHARSVAFPNLLAFPKRIAARPAVQVALRAEALFHCSH